MSLNEEIKKLETLLNDGAITQEEFQLLKEQLTGALNEFQEKPNASLDEHEKNETSSIGNEHHQVYLNNFKLITINGLKEIQSNNEIAGSNIGSSVLYAVLSQFSLVIAFLILMFGYFPVSMGVLQGSNSVDDLGTVSVVIGILGILSFIFWILQLTKLNNAGTHLKSRVNSLMNFSLSDDGRILIPDPELIETKGLKIGQEHGGGIIVFFDKSKLLAFIVSKDELEGSEYTEALKECKNYSAGGFSDWSLPDSSELILAKSNLRKYSDIRIDKRMYWCKDFCLFDFNIYSTINNIRKRVKGNIRPIRIAAL